MPCNLTKVQYRFFIRTVTSKGIQLNYKHTVHPNKMFEVNTDGESRMTYDTHPPSHPHSPPGTSYIHTQSAFKVGTIETCSKSS